MGSSVTRRLLQGLGLAALVAAPAVADAAVHRAELANARRCSATRSSCVAWERLDFHLGGITLHELRASRSGAHVHAQRVEVLPRWDWDTSVLSVHLWVEGAAIQDALQVASTESDDAVRQPAEPDLRDALKSYLPRLEIELESRGAITIDSAALNATLRRLELPGSSAAAAQSGSADGHGDAAALNAAASLKSDRIPQVALHALHLRRDTQGEIQATTNLRVTHSATALLAIDDISVRRPADGRRPDSVRASVREIASQVLAVPLDVELQLQAGQLHATLDQGEGHAQVWLSRDDSRAQMHLESDRFDLNPWLALVRRVPQLEARLAPIATDLQPSVSVAISACSSRAESGDRCLGPLALTGALDIELRGELGATEDLSERPPLVAAQQLIGDATLQLEANDLALAGLVLSHGRLSGEPVAFAPIRVSGKIIATHVLTTASLKISHLGAEIGLDASFRQPPLGPAKPAVATHGDPVLTAAMPGRADELTRLRAPQARHEAAHGSSAPTSRESAEPKSSADSLRQGAADLTIHVPTMSCQTLLDATPAGLLGTIAPTRLQGEVSATAVIHLPLASAHIEPPSDASDARFDLDFPFLENCAITRHAPGVEVAALRGPHEQRFVRDDGRLVRRILDARDPDFVPVRKAPLLAMAFVSLEDSQFRSHDGFDRAQIVRAFAHNLNVGRVERGASTISQQTARILWLGIDRSFGRKIQEAFLTVALESEVSKDRILELYLNLIELGPNVVGVKEAAQFYFHRAPEDLTLLQAIHLASLPPAPVRFAARFEDGTIDAQWREHLKTQMRRMQLHHLITREEATAALASPLGLVDRRPRSSP